MGTLEARDEVLARDTAAAVGLHALGPRVAAGGPPVPTEWIRRWHYDRPAIWSYATASTLYGWLCLHEATVVLLTDKIGTTETTDEYRYERATGTV